MERKFILDTDWYTDCDDCAALRYLVRKLDGGHKLLGVNVNAPTEFSYASVKAFLGNEGVDCPIAVDDESCYQAQTRYQKTMAGSNPLKNDCAEKSVEFYKRILEENEQVEILSIGFLRSLEKVFRLYPDLACKKIKKIWVMGGKWDEQGGCEYNIAGDGNQIVINASRFLINGQFCEMVFLGFEVGVSVITGKNLDKNDMLFKAFQEHGSAGGRPSWDPMLVMAGVSDNPQTLFSFVQGTAFIDEFGKNYFQKDEKGKHYYLIKKYSDELYESEIERYL